MAAVSAPRTKTADELNVTPAAISRQSKNLEESLGQSLFRRGARLALTEPAMAGAPLFTEAFDRLEHAVDRLRQGRDNGPLVVSAPPSFAARWLIPRLERFQSRHPEIELRLSATLLHNEAMNWDPTYPDWRTWLRAAGVDLPRELKLRLFGDANLVIQAVPAGLGAALVGGGGNHQGQADGPVSPPAFDQWLSPCLPPASRRWAKGGRFP